MKKSKEERAKRRWLALFHGGVWRNNLLFDGHSGKPIVGVPTGQEIHKEYAPDWRSRFPLKPNPCGRKKNHGSRKAVFDRFSNRLW